MASPENTQRLTKDQSVTVVHVRRKLVDECQCGANLKQSLVAEVFGVCSKCGKRRPAKLVRA